MEQLELPLGNSKAAMRPARTVQTEECPQCRLPLRWKAVFVLLILYAFTLTGLLMGRAVKETRAEAGEADMGEKPAAQVPAAATQAAGGSKARMSASVAGWYEVSELNGTDIHVLTNMEVWVNGREFVRCADTAQRFDPSLVDL